MKGNVDIMVMTLSSAPAWFTAKALANIAAQATLSWIREQWQGTLKSLLTVGLTPAYNWKM